MRISELADRSGVSTATIKYYVREGLLSAGDRTGYNTTEYPDAHLGRLRLIRAMIDVAGLPVTSVRAVLAAIDDDAMPLDEVFGVAQHALPTAPLPPTDAGLERMRDLMRARGWRTFADNPGMAQAARILDTFSAIGRDDITAVLPRFAEAAELVASADLDAVAASGTRERMGETVVVGTVLGDALFAGLRRIAQENETHRRYGTDPDALDEPCAPTEPAGHAPAADDEPPTSTARTEGARS